MAFLWGIDKSPHISRCAQAHSSSRHLDRRYREVGARRVLCHQRDSVCDSLSQQFSIMRKLLSWSKVKYMTWLTAINTKKTPDVLNVFFHLISPFCWILNCGTNTTMKLRDVTLLWKCIHFHLLYVLTVKVMGCFEINAIVSQADLTDICRSL